jgi:hypothetical protein
MKIEIKKIPDKMTWVDVMLLKAIASKQVISISNLYNKGLLNHNDELTSLGKEVISNVTIDDETVEIESNETMTFDEFIETYRQKFKGKKVGAIGDKQALVEKMVRFLKNYQYSYNHILNAIQLYINNEAANKYKYLTRAHYTVYKKTAREEVSILAAYCEELEEGTQVQDFNVQNHDNSNYNFI